MFELNLQLGRDRLIDKQRDNSGTSFHTGLMPTCRLISLCFIPQYSHGRKQSGAMFLRVRPDVMLLLTLRPSALSQVVYF